MTKPEIAKAILERRNRMTHVILPGEIRGVLGADGVEEALKQRWLVPDMDTGFLCATNDLGKVDEMRKLAAMPAEQYRPEPIVVPESHEAALWHTKRRLNEVAAPGTGGQSPGLTSISQPNPVAPAAAAPAAAPAAPATAPATGTPAGYPIGTPVTVSRQGVTANGVIEKLMPDGRYTIGYPTTVTQKPPGDAVFSKEELSAIPNDPGRPAR